MTLHAFLFCALVLFCLGLYAMLVRRHMIAMMIGLELMLNAASINFMAFNKFVVTDPSTGQIVVLFIIGLAAAEAAVLLSIVLTVYRARHSVNVEHLKDLQG